MTVTPRLRPAIAQVLALLLVVPLAEAADLPSAPVPQQQSTEPQSGSQQSPAPENTTPPLQTNQQPAEPAPAQNGATQPLGTAAAPVERTVGVPASEPAGAAIAPAKQRRTRSLAIRVSLIVGLAVAVGTVIGLSEASPSRPQ